VAEGYGNCIGGIDGSKRHVDAEDRLDHLGYLSLVCTSPSGYC